MKSKGTLCKYDTPRSWELNRIANIMYHIDTGEFFKSCTFSDLMEDRHIKYTIKVSGGERILTKPAPNYPGLKDEGLSNEHIEIKIDTSEDENAIIHFKNALHLTQGPFGYKPDKIMLTCQTTGTDEQGHPISYDIIYFVKYPKYYNVEERVSELEKLKISDKAKFYDEASTFAQTIIRAEYPRILIDIYHRLD